MKLLAIVCTTTALVLFTGCQRAAEPPPVIDVSFELTDESGRHVTAAAYSGQLRLVFFGFTSCPDVCPVTLHNIATALNSLGPLAERVTVLFISVDPKRDTPELLSLYTDAIHPSIIGLTGTYEQIAAVASGFRTTFGFNATVDGRERQLSSEEYEAMSPAAPYTPYHSSRVYVIGTDDELLDIIGFGSKPPWIEEKLRSYLDD